MPKISEEFASATLKAEDLQGREFTLTIRSAEVKTFKTDSGGAERKISLMFNKTDKEFILNKTNREIIKDLYGDDTDFWIGKQISIYATKVQYGSKMVWGLRVREFVPGSGPQQAGPHHGAYQPPPSYPAPGGYPLPPQPPQPPQGPPQAQGGAYGYQPPAGQTAYAQSGFEAPMGQAPAGRSLTSDEDIPF